MLIGNGANIYIKNKFGRTALDYATNSTKDFLSTIWNIKSKLESEAGLDEIGTWNHLPLYLVGEPGSGKTSLIRWLKQRTFEEKYIPTECVEISTAEVSHWKEVPFDITELMADALKRNSASVPAKTAAEQQQLNKEKDDRSMDDTPENAEEELALLSHTGILIKPDMIRSISQHMANSMDKESPYVYHVWDFSGHEVYNYIQHYMINPNAIFAIVVDISKPLQLDRIDNYIITIGSYCTKPTILIIGTHKDVANRQGVVSNAKKMVDKIRGSYSEENTAAFRIMQEIYNHCKSKIFNQSSKYCFAVNCKHEDPVFARKILLEVSLLQPWLGKSCKLGWMLFLDLLMKTQPSSPCLNDNTPHEISLKMLPVEKAAQIAFSCRITESEMRKCLQFFHNLGLLVYFEDIFPSLLFLDPQQFYSALGSLSTAFVTRPSPLSADELNLLRTEGKTIVSTLKRAWHSYSEHNHAELLTVFQKFKLGMPFRTPGPPPSDYLFPYLVDSAEQNPPEITVGITCSFKKYLPMGAASRLVFRILESKDVTKPEFVRHGCIFSIYGRKMKVEASNQEISIRIPFSSDLENSKEVISGLQQVFMIIEQTFPWAKPEYQVQCFNCTRHTFGSIFSETMESDFNFGYLMLCCPSCRAIPHYSVFNSSSEY